MDKPLTIEFLEAILEQYPENCSDNRHLFEMHSAGPGFSVFLTIDWAVDRYNQTADWYAEVNGGGIRPPQTVEEFWTLCQAIGLIVHPNDTE